MTTEVDGDLDSWYTPRPVPSKDDVLFRDDLPDWDQNAILTAHSGRGEHAYTKGYRRGARLIVEYVESHASDQDYLVYPIVFLYRHHVELALKSVLRSAPRLTGRPLTAAAEKHLNRSHKLDQLWADLRPVLRDIWREAGWGKPDPDEMAAVGAYIRQLCAVDPDSFSFRYTYSTEGELMGPPAATHINLRHFGEMMERFADYFDGLDTGLQVFEDQRAEMIAIQREHLPDNSP